MVIRVNVAEAKARFSAYLKTVEAGETVVVCRRNVPIAEIRAVPQRPQQRRRLGIDRGMVVPPSFFEPLPDALLDAFEGCGAGGDRGANNGLAQRPKRR